MAVRRALPEPQALLRLREEGDEPGSVRPGPVVGGPPEELRGDVRQGEGARRIREKREEGR